MAFAQTHKHNKRISPPTNVQHTQHIIRITQPPTDCDVAKYTFQLSIYAWILEKYYGATIAGLCLVGIHPEAQFHTWCPYLKTEVDVLMRKRREIAAARIALTAYGLDLPRCALTGQIAFDAVRTRDGRLVNEKDLAVQEEHTEYAVERDIRNLCHTALNKIVPTHRSEEELRLERDKIEWKQIIPVHGIPNFIDMSQHTVTGQ